MTKTDACYRCMMTFHIQPRNEAHGRKADYTRCHDCGVMFWHAAQIIDRDTMRKDYVKIGMDPEEYEMTFQKQRGSILPMRLTP